MKNVIITLYRLSSTFLGRCKLKRVNGIAETLCQRARSKSARLRGIRVRHPKTFCALRLPQSPIRKRRVKPRNVGRYLAGSKYNPTELKESPMGIKSWLARNTSNPSQYADTYTSGLMELIEYLAASLVAFSGQQPTKGGNDRHHVVFQDHFEMEMSGFLPATKDVTVLVEPSVTKMQEVGLFGSAYRDAT